MNFQVFRLCCSRAFVQISVRNFLGKTERLFCAQVITRDYGDRFSIAPKKKKNRKNASSNKASLRQSQVFQLDPLREDEPQDKRVTARQRVVSGAILEGVTRILNSLEVDASLRDCEIEITQVMITPNLQLASVYWTVSEERKDERVRIQAILEESSDFIRRLLPVYSSLNRLPQLAFVKDDSVEHQIELENLFHKAKHGDSLTEDVIKDS